jgi:hypothetical protein
MRTAIQALKRTFDGRCSPPPLRATASPAISCPAKAAAAAASPSTVVSISVTPIVSRTSGGAAGNGARAGGLSLLA